MSERESGVASVQAVLARSCTPRDTQRKLAEFLDAWRCGSRPVAAIQADTGTGKTRVLLSAAVAFVAAREPVTISVSTVALTRQIMGEAERFAWAGLRIGRRLGLRAFISPSRVRTQHGRLLANGASPQTLASMADLESFAQSDTGLIEDWLEQFGDLPGGLQAKDIALLPSARKADKQAYLAAREAAQGLDVSIQTHALTLMQARSGAVSPILIFDEADALAQISDDAEDRQLSLNQLKELLDAAGAPKAARDALALLREKPDDQKLRESLAAQVALHSEDEEVRWALSDARRTLTAHRLDGPRRGTEVRRQNGDIVIRSLWARRAGWVWRNLKDGGCNRAIFASATLTIGASPAEGLRALGVAVAEVSDCSVAPAAFGSMAFRIIGRDAPAPPKPARPVETGWRDAAASFIEPTMRPDRRTLVVTTSFDDAEWLARRFGVRAQKRGEKLHGLVQQMRTWELTQLVTPSGWVGIDLPGVLTDLVIWRLPYAAPDELRDDLAGTPGFPAINEAMLRKLRQGFGRGVRQATDAVLLWVADPRAHNRRLRVETAVPARFRDAWRAALDGRQLLPSSEVPVRPEQAAFRKAVLEADGLRCVATGCNILRALDAAHRPGRDWRQGHNGAGDGWTLRVDLHRLLDAGELQIGEDGSVSVSPSAREAYPELHGRRIRDRVAGA